MFLKKISSIHKCVSFILFVLFKLFFGILLGLLLNVIIVYFAVVIIIVSLYKIVIIPRLIKI